MCSLTLLLLLSSWPRKSAGCPQRSASTSSTSRTQDLLLGQWVGSSAFWSSHPWNQSGFNDTEVHQVNSEAKPSYRNHHRAADSDCGQTSHICLCCCHVLPMASGINGCQPLNGAIGCPGSPFPTFKWSNPKTNTGHLQIWAPHWSGNHHWHENSQQGASKCG